MEIPDTRHNGEVRVTLIVNPFASSVTPRTRIVIQKALSADHDLSVVETTKGGHATRLAHVAGKTGAEVVVALGGDGTINEVANGLLGTDTAIVALPGGSTNVFARAIGFANEPIEATGMLLEALAARSIISASVGLANGRAFLFHVGAGFDAAVVGKVEKRGPLKRYLGHPLFVASTISTWLRGIDRKTPWFSVESADGRIVPGAQLAVALNCNPYTFLGNRPLDLAPEASLHRPLSIVTLTSLTVRSLGPAAFKAIRESEGIPDGKHSRHWADVTSAVIRGFRPFPYQLDGEFLPPVTELTLEHRSDAINLVVPVS